MGPPRREPLLNRPVRALLDLRIGTVLGAYFAYIAIGLLLGLIAVVVFVAVGHGSGTTGSSSDVSWSPGAGDAVTPAEYRSVGEGAQRADVRRRFGKPAWKGRNPLDQVAGASQRCLGYRSSVADSTLFLFCFDGGRLVHKTKF